MFQTTSPTGLDHSLLPMRLWHKAKKLGVWDPRDVNLAQDRRDWQGLRDEERDLLLRLTSLFQAGEESVTRDLLPLLLVIAEEGRLEEEIYLTSFLWEEAKHVEAFRRFFDEIAHEHSDLARYHTPSYRRIFYQELPAAMNRLRTDSSSVAQAEASATYNMIVEGVLAETGYRAYDALLQRNRLMPGMQQVIGYLRRDEARHIAYGVFLLSRLVAEHGEPVWQAIEQRLDHLLEPALGTIAEIFSAYEVMPFGLRIEEFTDFALKQFHARITRLERARSGTVEPPEEDILAEDKVTGSG
jgi:ribonucleoside-diphosphate reductase beta chain